VNVGVLRVMVDDDAGDCDCGCVDWNNNGDCDCDGCDFLLDIAMAADGRGRGDCFVCVCVVVSPHCVVPMSQLVDADVDADVVVHVDGHVVDVVVSNTCAFRVTPRAWTVTNNTSSSCGVCASSS
jgi:hypothetical protein